MRTIIIAVFLLLAVSLYPVPAIQLSGFSFLGGYYYPEREDKEISYFDRQDIRFGITGLRSKPLVFEISLNYAEELLRDRLGLYSLFLVYQTADTWSGSFQIVDIGYGKPSEPFSRDLTDPEYDRYRLGNYRFQGIRFDHSLSSQFQASYRIGGNSHNTSIGTATLSFLLDPVTLDIFYLYTGRDNNLNKTMHSGGTELLVKSRCIQLRHAQSWQHLSSTFTTSNYISYGELLWQITEGLQAGSELFYAEQLRGYRNWRELSFLTAYSWRKLMNTVQYSRTEAGNLKTARVTGIVTCSLSDSLSVGLNTGIHIPQVGDNYYSFGLQVKFNEKFPL